ncbi:lysine N(6)-hydroxylase/L-ornithine N(5)-oxygenase family protein [Streptomyces sp. NPDC001380]|uniref:lysine N(6)-hydroxylase/L-ornithine N(5)-oxygenase family protein n=1 Tax=Streptomyces sp. NPDC001380 TaxID=3364566 RepID=UPI00369D0E46
MTLPRPAPAADAVPRPAPAASRPDGPDAGVLDLVGVGIGPFNLSLAALADAVPDLRALFLDAKPAFSWHPGLLLEGTTLQVPFLADLVTLADPTSRWSYLNYLRAHDRLFPFFFSERFHVPRREYDHYCRWVAGHLPSCRFDAPVTALEWDDAAGAFAVVHGGAGGPRRVLARRVVLGVGTRPVVPGPLRHLLEPGRVLHSADYLAHRDALAAADDVTVVGAGQSGAEVVLDLLRRQDGDGRGGPYVRWLARTAAFAPMEYSKIGLEHFTPDYVGWFRRLPGEVRDRMVREQWQLYKGVSGDTLGAIHDELYERTVGGGAPRAALHPATEVTAAERDGDGYRLTCRHTRQDAESAVRTGRIVLATGYAAVRPPFLEPVAHLVDWDGQGRYRVDGDYRVALDPRVTGTLFVQNAEMHTHGVGAPDLTLGAWRAAVILNAAAGRTVLRLPARTAWTTFGVPEDRPAAAAPGDGAQRMHGADRR